MYLASDKQSKTALSGWKFSNYDIKISQSQMTIQARDTSHTDTEEMPGDPAHVDAHGHFYKIYVNFPLIF